MIFLCLQYVSKFEGRTFFDLFMTFLWFFKSPECLPYHEPNIRPQCQQQANGLSREFIDHYLFDTCNNTTRTHNNNNEILHPFIIAIQC